MRNLAFCVVALLGACKKEEKPAPPAEAPKATEPVPGEKPADKAAPAVAAPADKAAPAVVAPAANAVTLAAGAVKVGCIGWSDKTSTAACLTGETGSQGAEVNLAFVGGSEAPTKLADPIDDKLIATATPLLAGYQPFAQPATKVTAGPQVDAGGISLKFTTVVTKKGGDNQAPTEKNLLVMACGGKGTSLYDVTEEGRSLEVSYRKIGGKLLVELASHLGREGEYASGFEAHVIDIATCKVD